MLLAHLALIGTFELDAVIIMKLSRYKIGNLFKCPVIQISPLCMGRGYFAAYTPAPIDYTLGLYASRR